MNTAWGELKVADAHVHFFSRRYFELLSQAAGPGEDAASICAKLGWPLPPEDPVELARSWIEELDRNSVSKAVLISSTPGDESSVAAAVAAFPERFQGYFFFNPLAELAAQKLRAALESGLRGACLFPAMHHYMLSDSRVTALLEQLAEVQGTVLFVHCGALSIGVRKKLGLPSQFDVRFSHPSEVQAVAARFPNLPVVIPHFGAGYLRETLMAAEMCPNILIDTSGTNSWTRFESLSMAEVFRRAVNVVGSRRLLFGTDSSFFPRGWNRQIFEMQSSALAEAGLKDEEAAVILGGNLIRLLFPKPD